MYFIRCSDPDQREVRFIRVRFIKLYALSHSHSPGQTLLLLIPHLVHLLRLPLNSPITPPPLGLLSLRAARLLVLARAQLGCTAAFTVSEC